MSFDYDLILFLNTDAFPFLDKVMWYVSEKWTWVPIYAVLLYFLYKKFPGKHFFWIVVFIALCITLNDQTASGLFKNWVGRLRPSHDPIIKDYLHYSLEPNGNLYKGGKFGFYSSHAANYAGVVTLFLLWIRPKNKWIFLLLILWPLLIGYSRIYLGVHFPTDVLMGWTMGVLIGYLCYRLWRWLMQKLYPKESNLFMRAPSSAMS